MEFFAWTVEANFMDLEFRTGGPEWAASRRRQWDCTSLDQGVILLRLNEAAKINPVMMISLCDSRTWTIRIGAKRKRCWVSRVVDGDMQPVV
jgi:hypothetical protein